MDFVTRYTDKAEKELAKLIGQVFGQAAREVKIKLDRFMQQHAEKAARMQEKLKAGEITQAQYESWMRGQMFQGRQWEQCLHDVTFAYVGADYEARQLVSTKDREVFVEAANYTAYDIEQGTQGAVSFNIYDEHTVARLLKDDPKMLPEWKIDQPKDYIWNEKRVQNAITQGIIQGESIPEISQRLSSGLASGNASKMMLFARTAMTGAQNAGRVERMKESKVMGINVRKKWLATLDSKTRTSHQKLDGTTADVDKAFKSMYGLIRYPGDPDADPRDIYNCRCTLIWDYPEYDQTGERVDNETKEVIPDQTYEEWKNRRGTEQKEAQQRGNIDAIRDMVNNHRGPWSLDDLDKVGGKMAEEVKARREKAIADIDRQIKEMRKRKEEALDRMDAIFDERAQAVAARDTERDAKLKAENMALADEVDIIAAKTRELLRQKNKVDSRMLVDTLREVRKVGGVHEDNLDNFINRAYMKRYIKNTEAAAIDAMNVYPSEWLQRSAGSPISLKPHWTSGRAYYSPSTGEIRFDGNKGTCVHELGHRFERVVPGLRESERQFYEKRTQGETLEWLGAGYRRDELTRRDKFLDAYMGKDYGGQAYELFSMGSEMAYTDYAMLERDPDMLRWVLGLLASL